MDDFFWLLLIPVGIAIWLARRYLAAFVQEIARRDARESEKDLDMQRKLREETKALLSRLREDIGNKVFSINKRCSIWKNQHSTIKSKLRLLKKTQSRELEILEALLYETIDVVNQRNGTLFKPNTLA
jgi:hypothetical protein